MAAKSVTCFFFFYFMGLSPLPVPLWKSHPGHSLEVGLAILVLSVQLFVLQAEGEAASLSLLHSGLGEWIRTCLLTLLDSLPPLEEAGNPMVASRLNPSA